jgi:hypothetical protein
MKKQTEFDEALRLLRARRKAMEDEILRLNADIEAIKRAEDILNESKQPSFLPPIPISNELAGLTPTKAVFKVLDDRPEKEWKAVELAKELLSRGYGKANRNFLSVISTTLIRLAKEGKIERIRKEGESSKYKKKSVGV